MDQMHSVLLVHCGHRKYVNTYAILKSVSISSHMQYIKSNDTCKQKTTTITHNILSSF